MSEKIILKNVRLSYEHLFHADKIAGDDASTPKYSASWIIPKDSPQVRLVRVARLKALDE